MTLSKKHCKQVTLSKWTFCPLGRNLHKKERWNLDEKDKKQVPLRLSASLWKELVAWAEDDFRSLNGQIEYLLHEAVLKRKNGSTGISYLPDRTN